MPKGKESFPRREARSAYSGGKTKETRDDTQGRGAKGKKQKVEGEKRGKTQVARQRAGETTRQSKRQTAKGRPPKKQMLLGVIVIAVLVILFIFLRKNGTEVFVGETSVGVLEGKAVTAQTIIDTIETQLEGIVGSQVKLNEEISTKRIHIWNNRKKDISTMDYLIPKIRNMVTYKVDAAIIMIDGGKGATLATQEQADKVLSRIQEPHLPAEGIEATVAWVEKVEVLKDFVDSEEIRSEDEAVASLQATTTVTGTYTVKSGDVFYKIAKACETTVEEILKRNDGMTINTPIKVGQILNVPVEKPKLSVKTIETQVLTTVEPKTYEYRTDSNQPKTYQKVLQQGRAGQKKSTIQITRVNGFVQEEKEVSKEIISEPVPEIIVRGSK